MIKGHIHDGFSYNSLACYLILQINQYIMNQYIISLFDKLLVKSWQCK